MAEKSFFWPSNGTGDGQELTSSDWRRLWALMFGSQGNGVMRGYGSDLQVVPNIPGPTYASVYVTGGGAIVAGFPYDGIDGRSFQIPVSSSGNFTAHTIVIRADWETQTVRLALVSQPDGNMDMYEAADDPGNVVELIIASVVVGDATNEVTILDRRPFIMSNTIVNAYRIGDEAVQHSHLGEGIVESDNLAEGSVGTPHILNDSIGTAKLADGSITEPKMADNAVVNRTIADEAVGNEKIFGGGVQEIHIWPGSVTEEKIEAGAVTSGKIGDNAVERQHLSDGVVGDAEIEGGAANRDKLGVGTFYIDRRIGGNADDWSAPGTAEQGVDARLSIIPGRTQITVPIGAVSAQQLGIDIGGWAAEPFVQVSVQGAAGSGGQVPRAAYFINVINEFGGRTMDLTVTRSNPGDTAGAEPVTVSWSVTGPR